MLTSLVPYAGHGIAGERLKYGVVLDVWHEDDCMPMEVLCKGIAFPATMCFDNVEGSPRRRYSSVALIRKPWPFKSSRLGDLAMAFSLCIRDDLVKGRWVFPRL